MEYILLINGLSPYLYYLVIMLSQKYSRAIPYKICLIFFLIQLVVTVILSIICKDKKRLAKVTMINKFVQIPYYVFFFLAAAAFVILGTVLGGIGILFLPLFVAVDFGVFLSTLIPEEICTINLRSGKHITTGKFLLYLAGNAFYVVDIVLSVLIYREYKRAQGLEYSKIKSYSNVSETDI